MRHDDRPTTLSLYSSSSLLLYLGTGQQQQQQQFVITEANDCYDDDLFYYMQSVRPSVTVKTRRILQFITFVSDFFFALTKSKVERTFKLITELNRSIF